MSKRPTEPGYYWARRGPRGGWFPCDVTPGWSDDDPLSVMPMGRDWSSDIDYEDFADFEWGDKLLPPGNSWAAIVEELCAANAQLTAAYADAGTREFVAGEERKAAVAGANLTLRTIVLALGGKPSEETNLMWVLKRIEELRE